MAHIYFGRTKAPHPLQARPLMSGVIEAASPAEAKAKLAAILTDAAPERCFMMVDEFDFADLTEVEGPYHGILAITVGDWR